MKILFASTRFPREKGSADSFTVFHLLKYFSSNGHKIHLICFDDKNITPEEREQTKNFCESYSFIRFSLFQAIIFSFIFLIKGLPMQLGYFYSNRYKNALSNIVDNNKDFDIKYFHLIRSGHYAQILGIKDSIQAMQTSFTLNYTRVVKNQKNIFIKFLYYLELLLIKKYERKTLNFFLKCLLISYHDLRAINGNESHKNVIFSPHGIDTEYFKRKTSYVSNDNPKIIFPANFSSEANKEAAFWMVNDVFPIIKKKYPNSSLMLLGNNPHKSIHSLKSDQILVTGFVDDLRPYLERGDILVNPIRSSSGMQNKVIMGLSFGIPVVTTLSSVEGMKIPEELLFLAGNSANDFALKVIDAIETDYNTKIKYISEGSIYAENYWTWNHHFQELEKEFKKISIYRNK